MLSFIFHCFLLPYLIVEKGNKEYTAKVCFDTDDWSAVSFVRHHYEVCKRLNNMHMRPIQCIPKKVELTEDAKIFFSNKEKFNCSLVLETYTKMDLMEFMKHKYYKINNVVEYLKMMVCPLSIRSDQNHRTLYTSVCRLFDALSVQSIQIKRRMKVKHA